MFPGAGRSACRGCFAGQVSWVTLPPDAPPWPGLARPDADAAFQLRRQRLRAAAVVLLRLHGGAPWMASVPWVPGRGHRRQPGVASLPFDRRFAPAPRRGRPGRPACHAGPLNRTPTHPGPLSAEEPTELPQNRTQWLTRRASTDSRIEVLVRRMDHRSRARLPRARMLSALCSEMCEGGHWGRPHCGDRKAVGPPRRGPDRELLVPAHGPCPAGAWVGHPRWSRSLRVTRRNPGRSSYEIA